MDHYNLSYITVFPGQKHRSYNTRTQVVIVSSYKLDSCTNVGYTTILLRL